MNKKFSFIRTLFVSLYSSILRDIIWTSKSCQSLMRTMNHTILTENQKNVDKYLPSIVRLLCQLAGDNAISKGQNEVLSRFFFSWIK
jgi:hypothetical protein